nr:MAG TPA: Thymidylate synthase complementing protein [Caudoviricetes sp.]
MRLINPSFEILEQAPGEVGIYKQIEKVGRVCWKSESKITEDSYKRFVEMLKSKNHGAVLEHGTVYLYFPTVEGEYYQHSDGTVVMPKDVRKYYTDKYSYCNYEDEVPEIGFYITTNFRVLVQNNWLDDLKYLCEPTEYHEKRVCVKFIMDRVGSQSFCRHRVFSFAQESTRYCKYSLDNFGSGITYIIPSYCKLEEGYYGFENAISTPICGGEPTVTEGFLYLNHLPTTDEELESAKLIQNEYTPFIFALFKAEQCYFSLMYQGWTPQQARQVLSNALKTELVMTGFISDWKHFFSLRDDKGHAHPDAYALAHPLHEEFIKRGYLNE